MNRRTLMMLAGGLPLMSTAHAQRAKPPFAAAGPAMPRWPSAAQWQELNAQVGGRLVAGAVAARGLPRRAGQRRLRPPSSAGLKNPWCIGDDVALTQTSGWADAWASTPSAYAVPARNAADVAAAVNFARDAPPAAGGEGRRPLLPGHVERARFAADLDAPDGPHRAARRLRGAGLQGRRRSRRCRSAPARSGCKPMPPSPRPAATCRAAAAPPWAWPA